MQTDIGRNWQQGCPEGCAECIATQSFRTQSYAGATGQVTPYDTPFRLTGCNGRSGCNCSGLFARRDGCRPDRGTCLFTGGEFARTDKGAPFLASGQCGWPPWLQSPYRRQFASGMRAPSSSPPARVEAPAVAPSSSPPARVLAAHKAPVSSRRRPRSRPRCHHSPKRP